MKEMQFSIEINAPKEKVWETLWRDETFREWAGILDPGTYMLGELKEGNEIQFISAENGYGVTSFVEKLVENEYLLLKHSADTKESGTLERDKEWTGGSEIYELSESDGVTTLRATFDVPVEMEDYFAEHYPMAFDLIKKMTEK
jgi:hypothetical protein